MSDPSAPAPPGTPPVIDAAPGAADFAARCDRRRIRRLDDTLANQIAAGEVVERPASVLKELLENALDSSAARIEVDVREGGRALVQVRDDGAGIHRDDLALALERHATSKIAAFTDLVAVRTMGFRGEALPSIASVSRLELDSRAAGAGSGWRVRVDGGAWAGEPEPTAHPGGTTVSVRDLFFNTPARRKFLRTERTELRHLEDVARRVALASPRVAMAIRHHDRVLFSVPAARDAMAERRRLGMLCGRAFADAAREVDVAATGMTLRGWVGAQGADRAHADLQHFFVNGRAVSDQLARHAVRVALGERVAPGRHPAYVLFLDVDPAEVDVNVHPAKHEVRFREARLVHDFITRGLVRTLGDAHGGASPQADALPGLPSPEPGSAEQMRPGQAHPGQAHPGHGHPGHGSRPGARAVAETLSGYARLAGGAPVSPPGVLAVPGGRYLALSHPDGLALVDLARARRAWLAYRAGHGGGAREGAATEHAGRPLLVPVSQTVGEDAAERLEARIEALGALGLDLRRVAPDTVSLRAVPILLERIEPGALLAALVGAGGAGGAPQRAAELREALLDRVDLAAHWRADAHDSARMLAVMDTLAEAPGVRMVLDARALARALAGG